MLRSSLCLITVLVTTAHAGDRADCQKGDNHACARIGRLKQLGALKPDGTADLDVLATACGKALAAAKSPSDIGVVARPCGPLFNAELQKGYEVFGVDADDKHLGELVATAYAEAYCPILATPVTGCDGKKSVNFDKVKPEAVRAALSALNAAALVKELGTDKAKPLASKFDAAWPRLLSK
jgi:hypothetical protein